ncbi:hypothetical protein SAMN04488020_1194 [Palleronia marisminoris]|uniref:DUF3618 domain-containing protein n=1 Tax=Palleronia marisminoris TaxID=315423 RepID=A0A1Y5TXH6_9RHOB|nr:hypothetical protein [Palleronia marisminoris]SFH51084.1 hypothetical protein SAMN04488020_1194 [Palleronia marisminoris]SLN70775.1 hypothetical protein PAM7066_03594 [Palleronia marisminoris]
MADKSSREIERDLEHQRDELRHTIDEALDRMTLEGAWTYAGKYLRDHRSAYGQTLGSVIKEKPLAVGLVAVGMAWIMFGPSNVAREAAREDRYGRDDRRDDAETRRRLEAGDFDDTTARGPTGRDARPDPWAAPSRTPSPTSAGTGAVGGATSPTTSTSTTPGGTSSSTTGTSSGPSSTRRTGDSTVTAPAVAPASTPPSSTGTTTSTGSTGSGSGAGGSDTSSGTTTTDPKSSKV